MSSTEKGLSSKKTVSGIIQITRKGVGYVAWPLSPAAVLAVTAAATAGASKPEKEQEDIEIALENLGGAFNGDVVEVELGGLAKQPERRFGNRGKEKSSDTGSTKQKGARFTGKVVAVIERAKTEFVCTLKHENNKWVAVADDTRVYRPFHIETIPQGTKENTKVLVKLVSFYGDTAASANAGGLGAGNPLGEILAVIGQAGEHRAEMNSIVIEHGFRTEFSKEIQKEAKKIEAEHAATIEKELKVRKDYRHLDVMTIDPTTAQDFDDALSVQALPSPAGEGAFEVGVHIADASYYCVPGTAIDDEAQKRGTSVYLVDATIPMLPHEISAGVASLKADEDRLAFSGFFTLNAQGTVLAKRFEKTVIRSKKRFSYEEAQDVLDTQNGSYLAELNMLLALATNMRKQRFEEGAIDFGDNEVVFELDESGVPLSVTRKERIDTNWLIEEFMLLCNREVSEYISKLAEKVPEKNYIFLYRIHDEPKADRINELATFVRAIGYEFGHRDKKKYSAKDIQHLLEQVDGKPEAALIRTATLRSMAKAIYSTKNIGHFGLSFKYYTQFTSPIRRYPDLLAHRIVESHLNGNPITRREYIDLEKRCLLASEQEAKATDADRESIRYKLVEYMMTKVGQSFDGIISGVTDWGLYVEEEKSTAEGLVRVKTIGGDFYNHSQKEYSLVGERTKKKYTLGDRVRVKLVAADLLQRTLDFELV